MSGGSYEYLYSKLENGEVDRAWAYSKSVENDLKELHKQLKDPTVEMKHFANGVYCNLTPDERVVAGVAVSAALVQWQDAMSKIKTATEDLTKLSKVVHDLEWWQSGDYVAGQVVDGCVEYMREILKLPKET